jgi:hypothetical protein
MQTLPAEAVRARVEAMAIEGLLEELPDGAEPRYAVTDWGRLAGLAAEELHETLLL